MKGLFIKDLMILKSRKQIFFVVAFLAVMYALLGMHAFAMQFLGLLGASSVISTLSYDFMDNGGTFLFALPFTRRQYVAEKYLISIGGGVVGLLVGLLVVGFGVLTGTPIDNGELFGYVALGVLIAIIMVSLMIPLEIKFGAEQSRTAMFAVIAGIFIVVIVVAKILPEAIVARIVVFLMHRSQAQLVAGLVGICVVLVAISVFLSDLFLKKKEF